MRSRLVGVVLVGLVLGAGVACGGSHERTTASTAPATTAPLPNLDDIAKQLEAAGAGKTWTDVSSVWELGTGLVSERWGAFPVDLDDIALLELRLYPAAEDAAAARDRRKGRPTEGVAAVITCGPVVLSAWAKTPETGFPKADREYRERVVALANEVVVKAQPVLSSYGACVVDPASA